MKLYGFVNKKNEVFIGGFTVPSMAKGYFKSLNEIELSDLKFLTDTLQHAETSFHLYSFFANDYKPYSKRDSNNHQKCKQNFELLKDCSIKEITLKFEVS